MDRRQFITGCAAAVGAAALPAVHQAAAALQITPNILRNVGLVETFWISCPSRLFGGADRVQINEMLFGVLDRKYSDGQHHYFMRRIEGGGT